MTPRVWLLLSTAPAAGSATRPSGCSCTRTTARPSVLCATLAGATRRPQTRIQVIWTLSLAGRAGRGNRGFCLGRRSPASETQRRQGVRGDAQNSRQGWQRRCWHWPPIPIRASGFRWPFRSGTGAIRGPGKRSPSYFGATGAIRWIRAAVLSSAVPHVETMLVELFKGSTNPPPQTVIEPLVIIAWAIEHRGATDSVIRAISAPAGQGGSYASWQFAAARGLFEASRRWRRPIESSREQKLLKLHAAARHLVEDGSATIDQRIGAVNLLGFMAASKSDDRDLLVGLLKPRVAIEVQQAAISALARSADAKVPELLLARLEDLFAADPRRRSGRGAKPQGVDGGAPLGARGNMRAARGDRSSASRFIAGSA